MKLEFSLQIFKKIQISNLMKILSAGAAMSLLTHGQTDMTKFYFEPPQLHYIHSLPAVIYTTALLLHYTGIWLHVSAARSHHHPLKY